MFQDRARTYAVSGEAGGIDKLSVPSTAGASDEFRIDIVPLENIPEGWRAPWDKLAAVASEVNVFSERWFLEASVRHLRPSSEIWIIAAWDGPDLIGLMPMTIACTYGRMHVAHVENWLHHQSFLGSPLVRSGDESRFWKALLCALDTAPWARGFFHLNGLVEDGPVHFGLVEAARQLGRPCDTVYRRKRALLASQLSSHAYYENAIRKKKRKEIGRLSSRLHELGKVQFSTATSAAEVERYCSDYLRLEAAGWKGKAGTALACGAATENFFRDVVRGAFAADRLELLRLDVDERPIAMLVNLIAPPGAFSFKITFDEEFARFSPGVLIQIENLRILDRNEIRWMDSCAMDNHPMIDSLWTERRTVVRVTVPLAGRPRRLLFHSVRSVERASAWFRQIRQGAAA